MSNHIKSRYVNRWCDVRTDRQMSLLQETFYVFCCVLSRQATLSCYWHCFVSEPSMYPYFPIHIYESSLHFIPQRKWESPVQLHAPAVLLRGAGPWNSQNRRLRTWWPKYRSPPETELQLSSLHHIYVWSNLTHAFATVRILHNFFESYHDMRCKRWLRVCKFWYS
jgi:hypothetical protein